ncbi:MAG: hypothetical protein K8T89_01710 [Planctomycetes bacterium]|nr:hypothetical protein [Planctomycetota bacterium]
MKSIWIGLFGLLVVAGTSSAADELKIKAEKIAPPAEIKAPIKELLGEDAIQVHDAKGTLVCTIWFRKEIPSKGTPEQVKNGLTYREIAPTTVIGAIQLPQKWIDFRKQEIPKGTYTLRLGIQPMDGDHMGTAPHNEFCLLCPADKDVKPDTMEVKTMNELSATSHGATHPVVMLLFPNSKPIEEPKLVAKGNGIFVLNVKRAIVAGTAKTSLGFGFTVGGHAAE